jgi:3-methyl-2-oxobutanoate hydroxymethyltransferase
MSNPSSAKVTIETLRRMKRQNDKAVFLTAYDYPTATFAERAGVDMLLVGDSAAMTMMGLPTTLGITLEEMLTLSRAVCRATRRAFVVGDMPFLTYQPSDERAIDSAGAFLVAGCDAVKCEGGVRMAGRVRAMTGAGIAVMGHVGLTPQSVAQTGGYRVQGKTRVAAQAVLADARALQDAGAFSVLLEAMPPEAAALVRDGLGFPSTGSVPARTSTASSSSRTTCWVRSSAPSSLASCRDTRTSTPRSSARSARSPPTSAQAPFRVRSTATRPRTGNRNRSQRSEARTADCVSGLWPLASGL